MKLVRTRTRERRCERPFYGIRVETMSKGKRETNDHLERRTVERGRGKVRWRSWNVA